MTTPDAPDADESPGWSRLPRPDPPVTSPGVGVLHSHADPPSRHPLAARHLWGLVVGCALLTLIGAAALWPGGEGNESSDPLLLDSDTISAEVVEVELRACSYSLLDRCRFIELEMSDGPYAGEIGASEESNLDGFLDEGDDILVIAFSTESGDPAFSFYDHQRGRAMVWLLALFLAAVLLLGRFRGLGAVGGLAFTLLVIVVFTLPAILDGSNSLAVALVTASLIAFAALFLAHGAGLATAVALASVPIATWLAALVIAGDVRSAASPDARREPGRALRRRRQHDHGSAERDA